MRRPGTSYDEGRVETVAADDLEGFPASAYLRPDGRILEDLTAALQESLLDASTIEVSVSAGAVTLEGTVPSASEVEQAGRLAQSVRGVRSVRNRLLVR